MDTGTNYELHCLREYIKELESSITGEKVFELRRKIVGLENDLETCRLTLEAIAEREPPSIGPTDFRRVVEAYEQVARETLDKLEGKKE